MLKRTFDIVISALLLVMLAPIFVAVAVMVKLDSPGPVFHRAERAGRNGRPFTLLKFRSMVEGAAKLGPRVTRGGDSRVTRVGRLLRKSKLDELPQLINVLLGEMSLVGPRPEDARYVALYTPDQRQVLSVRPGITSLASISFRDEESILAGFGGDVEDAYVNVVMPAKLRIDLEYVNRQSLLLDLAILARTAVALFRPTATPVQEALADHRGSSISKARSLLARHLRPEVVERVLADMLAVNLALAGALIFYLLSTFATQEGVTGSFNPFDSAILQDTLLAYGISAVLLTVTCILCFGLCGFYSYGRAYRGRYKGIVIFVAVTAGYLTFGLASHFISAGIPNITLVDAIASPALGLCSWALTLGLVGGLRVGAAVWRSVVWAEASTLGRPPRRSIRSILVIGGAGYIGSILVRKLLDLGYNVTVLDALIYGDDAIRGVFGRPGFDFVHADLRDLEAVVRSMRYADAVVHLGALVGDPACALDESLTLDINLAATRTIAEAAKGFGVERFIFASTCSVYGASNQVLTEQSALNPVSLYARTKIGAERIVLSMSDHRFAPVILRFGTIYGLSPRPRFDLVINLLVARAVCEGSITIQGGEQWRPFVHVDDVAEAIIRCIEAPLDLVRGQIFNVGSDEQNYQIAQIGEIISTLVPGVEVVNQGDAVDPRNYRVSFAKIRRTLGFAPRHTVASGVLEIKSAIESGLISKYQDMRYSNYKTLSESTLVELSQGAGVLSFERYRMQFSDELTTEKAKPGNHQTLPLAG